MDKINCKICNREYTYERSKGHTKEKCNTCSVNLRRFTLKERCLEYKGNKCELCDYSKSKRALSFHHKDPEKKDFNIGGSHCKSWDSIKLELDKCRLLCMNCHMEEHEKLDYREENKKQWTPKPVLETSVECKQCGEKKYRYTKGELCKKCSPPIEQAKKINWPSKEELTKLVWELPATKLADMLGVSDKAIEKHCKKNGINKPGLGYWRKLETGKL